MRFFNAASLVNELIVAQDKHLVERFMDSALRHQLIVLDEFGFIPFSPTRANLLFQFCSALHDRVAIMLTTNLNFADWTQILGNQTLTAALLDRLTHRANWFQNLGSRLRAKRAQRRRLRRVQADSKAESRHRRDEQ